MPSASRSAVAASGSNAVQVFFQGASPGSFPATTSFSVGGEPTAVAAADLIDAWRAAQKNDLEYIAAQSARQAGATKREQGASFWRPSVLLTV